MDAPAGLPLYDNDNAFGRAQAELSAAGLADGLPLVVPTAVRLGAMLAGVADADEPFGMMPPLFGELTPRAVAYQCVLAGCEPRELPVVMTAAAACLGPSLNLLGLLTTTGTPAIALAVHGDAVGRLGFNAGTNALGPGCRVNACVGRALSLVLRNIGGATEGVADMATMGQPGKYGFCFGEGVQPGWPGYAERLGVDAAAGAVTVFGVSGTAEVLPSEGGATEAQILEPVAAAMRAFVTSTGARDYEARGLECGHLLLLPPELASALQRRGLTPADAEQRLAALVVDGTAAHSDRAAHHVRLMVVGGPGVKMSYLPLWAGGSEPQTLGLPPPV